MNGDDERDYAEEADVRAEAEREGLAEQAAERAQLLVEHLTGPGHFRQAEALLTAAAVQAESAAQELGDEDDPADPLLVLLRAVAQLSAANTHAVLALAAATAANIRRNGAVTGLATWREEGGVEPDIAGEWFEVLR